jgi:hypothetical protein
MIRCTKCGQDNLPSLLNCGTCGAALIGSAPGAFAPGDEAARYAAERATSARRKRVGILAVLLAGLGVFAWSWMTDARRKAETQEKLDFAGRWVELEKKEMGLVWNCVMASEVDIGQFSNATQVQQRVEAAYITQQKTFSEHLLTECVPKLERARQAFASLSHPPAEFEQPLAAYLATLPELQKGVELYAERIKNRGVTKDLAQLVQEYGNAWHREMRPTAETIAYEKFMHCAVPGLARMKDTQQMLEYLAEACYKKDPVAFMERVRRDCGSLLEQLDTKATPAKTYKMSQKRFYEEDARQLQAWESCGRRAGKGKKVGDLGEFLAALGDYMKARFGVKNAAQALIDEAAR